MRVRVRGEGVRVRRTTTTQNCISLSFNNQSKDCQVASLYQYDDLERPIQNTIESIRFITNPHRLKRFTKKGEKNNHNTELYFTFVEVRVSVLQRSEVRIWGGCRDAYVAGRSAGVCCSDSVMNISGWCNIVPDVFRRTGMTMKLHGSGRLRRSFVRYCLEGYGFR